MIRQTSVEAYNRIKEEGLLSERRWQAYDLLYRFGPCTAMELRNHMPKGIVDSQIRARLNELREMGVVTEVRERVCSVTGMNVIEWGVTDKLPTKYVKVGKIKCKHCKGTGYLTESQAKLF